MTDLGPSFVAPQDSPTTGVRPGAPRAGRTGHELGQESELRETHGRAATGPEAPNARRIIPLKQAAAARSQSSTQKIESAVAALRQERKRVTPTALHALTGCSRTTINRNEQARLAILADRDLPAGPALPLAARATEDSWRARALNAETAARELRARLADAESSITDLVAQLRAEQVRSGRRGRAEDGSRTTERKTEQ